MSSDEDYTETPCSVKELRKQLDALGLSKTGNKRILKNRLEEARNKKLEKEPEVVGELMVKSGELERVNKEKELMEKELNLLKREKELLEKEKEIILKEKLPVAEDKKECTSLKRHHFYADLISDFAGDKESFEKWKQQIDVVQETFEVEEKLLKIVVIGKLRGRVQTWFRSRPENIKLTLEELFAELQPLLWETD